MAKFSPFKIGVFKEFRNVPLFDSNMNFVKFMEAEKNFHCIVKSYDERRNIYICSTLLEEFTFYQEKRYIMLIGDIGE